MIDHPLLFRLFCAAMPRLLVVEDANADDFVPEDAVSDISTPPVSDAPLNSPCSSSMLSTSSEEGEDAVGGKMSLCQIRISDMIVPHLDRAAVAQFLWLDPLAWHEDVRRQSHYGMELQDLLAGGAVRGHIRSAS